jgi:hypothetical protein
MRMISFVMATSLFFTAAAVAAEGPTDAQIAAIVVTAN